MNMDKIRIALADDHQLFRNGLKILLGSYADFDVRAEVSKILMCVPRYPMAMSF